MAQSLQERLTLESGQTGMRAAVYDADAHRRQGRSLVIEEAPPRVHAGLTRIDQRGGVRAVEVDAPLKAAVEAAEQDPGGPEAGRDVDSLEPAVVAPAYLARPVVQDLVDLAHRDPFDVRIADDAGLR